MTRPTYTARQREALHVVRNADGMLEIGNGRVRIARGEIQFFRRVVAALGYLLDVPGGAEAIERGDALGQPIIIMQPGVPTAPPNAWTMPNDVRKRATGSTIMFDPDDWPREGDPDPRASHEVLLKLVQQANAYAEGLVPPPALPRAWGARQAQLRLSCRPGRVGDVLAFPYTVENPGPGEVYVMDAVADAGNRMTIQIGPDGDATVGMFIPPRPTDRQMAMPVIPLARRLAAGAALEHRLEIATPYAETSPWLPDVPVPREQPVDIKGVVLAIAYWPAVTQGLVASTASSSLGLHAILAPDSAALATQRFPTNGLKFYRRTTAAARAT